VRLGQAGTGPRVRVVRILGQAEQLCLATNLSEPEMSAQLVSLCYRQRWQVELFFRWLKHTMGASHWMAESKNGVSIQIYLTLIAAQLLLLFSGQRPNRRGLELLQFMVMGWASPAEVVALLKQQSAKAKKKNRLTGRPQFNPLAVWAELCLVFRTVPRSTNKIKPSRLSHKLYGFSHVRATSAPVISGKDACQ